MNDRLVPYDVDYAVLQKLRKVEKALLYLSFIISAAVNLFAAFQADNSYFGRDVTSLASIITMAGYSILQIINDNVVFQSCENKRRAFFIDASLGSKLAGGVIDPNFYNPELGDGIYKLAVNGFENCFFTYSISKLMQPGVIKRNIFLSVIFLIFAYFGFRNVLFFGVIVFQMLLSTLFLADLIKLSIYVARNKQILDHYKMLFDSLKDRDFGMSDIAQALRNIMDYEANLSWSAISLDSDIYKENVEQLNSEWDAMKEQYNIRDHK